MPALRINVGLVVNPLIHGLSASSSIEARSAPSAKIFTRKEATSAIFQHSRARGSENPLRSFTQRADADKRTIRALFGVAVVDEYCAATGAMAGLDVAPAIAHDETGFQIDIPNA